MSSSPLAAVFPAIDSCLDAIRNACEKYDITTVNEAAAFIAQCGYESAGFATFAENLNYSAHGLLATFPSHFNGAQAQAYARQPLRIANRVYANRLGNGDEASGDGWRYRGRGAIQITGKANYLSLAKALGKSLDETISYLGTDDGALMSAGWFWDSHKLNDYADAGNLLAITKAINGGTNGLQARVTLYGKVRAILYAGHAL